MNEVEQLNWHANNIVWFGLLCLLCPGGIYKGLGIVLSVTHLNVISMMYIGIIGDCYCLNI